MSVLRELWCVLTPGQRRVVLGAQAVSLVMALSTVTGIAAIGPFFALLGNPSLAEHNPVLHWLYVGGGFSSEPQFLLALGGAFIALVLLSNLVNVLGLLAMHRVAARIGRELKTTLFEEYLARPYLFHVRARSAELFDRIIFEAPRVSEGVLQSGFVLVTQLATGALIVVSVLLVQPVIAMAMLLTLGGGYLAVYLLVRKRLLDIGRAHSSASTEQARIVNESFAAIREILLLRDPGPLHEEFARVSRSVVEGASRVKVVGQVPKYVMECVAVAALVGVAVALGAAGSSRGGAWLGQLTFVAFAAYRLLPMLQQVFVSLVRIRADRAGLALISPDLRAASAAGERRRTRPELRCELSRRTSPHASIRLRHVWFRYGPGEPWALQDVSVDIAAHTMVGLTGANGSGKTTLLDLLAGLISPDRGELQLGDLAVSERERAAWRERIAYVPQHVFLLESSIAGNIAFGVPESAIDAARVARAARLAGLDELIAELPGGYAHRVGERGVRLSGGQRQRIGIARALYREAPVLLLDEPASALDAAAEAGLIRRLRRLRRECTIVLVSHRRAAMQACDLVYQLERGRLRASGSGAPRGPRSPPARRDHEMIAEAARRRP